MRFDARAITCKHGRKCQWTARYVDCGSVVMRYDLFFFFSSRRRHTRFDCDWSSDVCSSDLEPTVVIFDDLHWADAQSVALFERLAEYGSGPRGVVGTYRPEALSRRNPVAEVVPRLQRRRAGAHLHLHRLTMSEGGGFLAAVDGRAPPFRVVEALPAPT